jgi:hypothetical protein
MKQDNKVLIVFVDVVVFNWTTSGHFEWAHTRTKNILSMNGPAKSTWTLSQGADGIAKVKSHFIKVVYFGEFV